MVIQYSKSIPYLNEIDKVYLAYSPREMNKSECAYYLMPKEDYLQEDDVWFTEQKFDSSHLRYSAIMAVKIKPMGIRVCIIKFVEYQQNSI